MSTSFLHLHGVDFTYPGGTDPVLQGLTLTLPAGWTGVVGANGAGKSTLLRLAAGDLEPTRGSLAAGGQGLYCPQRTDEAPPELERLQASRDGDAWRWRLRLGLQEDWAGRWDSLSHGERKRAQLAVALWLDPPLLAVDEPTNHVDAGTRTLVQEALAAFRGIGLLVSHDRELLDGLCGQCLFLDARGAVLRPGGYTQGAEQRGLERRNLARERAAADREVRLLEAERRERREQAGLAERQRSKRHLAPGDRDAREKIDRVRVSDHGSGQRLRQLDGRWAQAQAHREGLKAEREHALGIRLGGAAARGPRLLHLPETALPLGPGRSLRLPALVLHPRDRVGISGPNGSGKSTLVRHLLALHTLPAARVACLPQELGREACRAVLAEALRLPSGRLGRLMTLVRRLGSDPARLLQSAEPSPGETRKLMLALQLEAEPHLLVLDEPTNHLDLPSVECLEEALAGFAGALVLVSHDRRFLERLAGRRWRIVPEAGGSRLEEELQAGIIEG